MSRHCGEEFDRRERIGTIQVVEITLAMEGLRERIDWMYVGVAGVGHEARKQA